MSKPRDIPLPLRVSAVLAALQGVGLLLLTGLELNSLTSGRLALGLAVAAFFAGFAALLLAAAWSLLRGDAWARGPVLMTQLVQLGVAWGTRDGAPAALTAALVLVAAAALLGLLHPASVERLARE